MVLEVSIDFVFISPNHDLLFQGFLDALLDATEGEFILALILNCLPVLLIFLITILNVKEEKNFIASFVI